MIRSFVFIVSVFSLLFATLPATHASQNLHIETAENPRVEVTLESFLDETPESGFAPVLVTLRNRTDAAQTFRLNYTVADDRYSGGRTFTGNATIQVEARGRSQTYVYVPVPVQTNWVGVKLDLNGPDIKDGSAQINSRRSNSTGSHVGMTDSLAAKHWSAIESEIKKIASSGKSSRDQINGTKFSPAGAPPDWRAYSGFTSIWMTAGEWNDIDPGARTAICEWIGFGGKLVLVAKNQAQRDAAKIPGAVRESAGECSLGLGKILFHSDENAEKFISLFINTTQPEQNIVYALQSELRGSYRHSGSGSSSYVKNWGLANIIGQLSRSIWPLSIFMILFALAIGPVNFFVLAPSKRRHRILWTTPLIALAASALLAVFILLSDGTGGTGARLTFACLLPEQKRLLVQQEQISKTGLLLGTSFDFDAGTEIIPIEFPGSRDSGKFSQTATGRSGDWFASRALQAQYMRTVRSARGGVHVTLPDGGADGNVIVALDMPLKEFFVLSPDGASAYKAENLAPGVRSKLVKIEISQLDEAWKKMCKPAGEVIRKGAENCAGRAGWFYAVAKNPGENVSETLRSIDWKTDTALVAGPAKFEDAK